MITPDLLKDVPLFAEVPHAELATIAGRAADIELREGEWLIHEGEAPAFFILLSGRLAVSKSYGGNRARHQRVRARYVFRRTALAPRVAGDREPARYQSFACLLGSTNTTFAS